MKTIIARALLGIALLATIAISSAQTVQYGNFAARWTGTGAADEALLFTALGTEAYDKCSLMSPLGTVDVEVTLDGTNWSTVALSLIDYGATAITTAAIITVAARVYQIQGRYLGIRVRQEGATNPTTASMLCWND